VEASLHAIATAEAIPIAIANKPELGEDTEIARACFFDCQTDRPAGLSPCPIPYTSVANWCHVQGIADSDDIQEIWEIVHRADVMVMEHIKGKPELGKAPDSAGAPVAVPAPMDYAARRRAANAAKAT
jgi:hypothetical protein